MIFGWILIFLSVFVVSMTLLAANGKIAPNGLLGIRTPATQRNAPAWRRAHAAAAKLLIPGCAVAVILGTLLIVGTFGAATDTTANFALLGFVVFAGVSAFVADRAARQEQPA